MKQQIGGLLAAALGAVLLTGGLSGAVSGAVGVLSCGTITVGTPGGCPAGDFVITEHDGAVESAAAQPGDASRNQSLAPATWTVTISTTTPDCDIPTEGGVDVVTVPDGASADSAALEEYTSTADTTKCAYTLTETPVAGYAASFSPVNPEILGTAAPDAEPGLEPKAEPVNASVLLTNTLTTTTSTSPSPIASAAATASASPTLTPDAVVDATSAAVAPADTDRAATLPFTGARAPVKPSVVIGIALILLGATVFGHGQYAGRKRPRRH